MNLFAQAGLGVAGGAIYGLALLVCLVAVTFPIVFLLVYYCSELVELCRDMLLKRNPLQRMEADFPPEGRLLDENAWLQLRR